jgi:hypothetical protein
MTRTVEDVCAALPAKSVEEVPVPDAAEAPVQAMLLEVAPSTNFTSSLMPLLLLRPIPVNTKSMSIPAIDVEELISATPLTDTTSFMR